MIWTRESLEEYMNQGPALQDKIIVGIIFSILMVGIILYIRMKIKEYYTKKAERRKKIENGI